MSCPISAESILIPGESTWIQTRLRVKRADAKGGRGEGDRVS